MKALAVLVLGVVMLAASVPDRALSAPRPAASRQAASGQARGTILTWSHATFAFQPVHGKVGTFLLSKATRVYGKPVKGSIAAVWYTVDKTGKMWATRVKIVPPPRKPARQRPPARHRSPR